MIISQFRNKYGKYVDMLEYLWHYTMSECLLEKDIDKIESKLINTSNQQVYDYLVYHPYLTQSKKEQWKIVLNRSMK